MPLYFVTEKEWCAFLADLSRAAALYYPEPSGDDYQLTRAGEGMVPGAPFSRYRMVQSFKPLLFEPRVKVGDYFAPAEELPRMQNPQAVIGVKGCDLKALVVLDFVFTGEVADPFYARNRERTIIISSDCTAFKETCFCTCVGGKPFPEKGFDLNASPVEGGYVIHVGSPRGQGLVERHRDLFAPATEDLLRQVVKDRERLTAQLDEQQRMRGYLWGGKTKELMERVYESNVWEEEAARCVECGACNFVCPTCHCFLLSDHGRETFRRMRNWDSCQYKGFARVGGGANPRPELYQRLRNRYEKKLHFGPVVMGVNGCTGCGRCVEACIGKIDLREVLKKLSGCR
ncbi:MAG: 4Fe-4S dicluster domain-containing protein [Candidatus Aureabacteria bacterium]|nr:4Fe-4S dicluster domain-containing protein [Candidatus Auribacterota bacterium]